MDSANRCTVEKLDLISPFKETKRIYVFRWENGSLCTSTVYIVLGYDDVAFGQLL